MARDVQSVCTMRVFLPTSIACAAALMAAACVELDGGDTLDPNGKISTNGLHLDDAALAALDTAPLGDGWLSATEVRAAASHAQALGASEAGRELLRYVAYCALPPGETLVVEIPGDDRIYEMPGRVGLAPAWTEAPCDESCQRWMSACLLAHANGQSAPVEISLRGEHPALAWTPAVEEQFDVEEAAYYGNVFGSTPEKFACIGRGLFDGTWAGQMSYLEGRICGLTGGCGLRTTGTCHSLTGDGFLDTATCRRGGEGGEAYGNCHVEARNHASPFYAEVVTVYLAR
jgi:hypothetical protein